jgi:hypothetical protein
MVELDEFLIEKKTILSKGGGHKQKKKPLQKKKKKKNFFFKIFFTYFANKTFSFDKIFSKTCLQVCVSLFNKPLLVNTPT